MRTKLSICLPLANAGDEEKGSGGRKVCRALWGCICHLEPKRRRLGDWSARRICLGILLYYAVRGGEKWKLT